MATRLSTSNNRKMILTSAAVIAVGLGAYGLGRVYPPLGPSAAPSLRPSATFRASSAVRRDARRHGGSQLMQTDAFELMVHDPSFRALAASPGFQAIAAAAGDGGAARQPAGVQRAGRQSAGLRRLGPGGAKRCVARAQSASGERRSDGRRRRPSGAMRALASHPEALSAVVSNRGRRYARVTPTMRKGVQRCGVSERSGAAGSSPATMRR